MFRKLIVLTFSLLSLLGIYQQSALAQTSGCTYVQASPDMWPDKQYTQTCGGANGAYMLGAFNTFSNDFLYRLQIIQTPVFYDFPTQAAFLKSKVGSLPAKVDVNDFGLTPRGSNLIPVGYTAIFDQNAVTPTPAINDLIANTTAHEAGHSLDYVYASVVAANNAVRVIVSGTPTTGDIITATAAGPNGDVPAYYTVQNSDDIYHVCYGIADAMVNAMTSLKVSATGSLTTLSVSAENNTSSESNDITYTFSSKSAAGGAGTEKFTKTIGALPSDATNFNFTETATAGDLITIAVHDSALKANNPTTVSYTVPANPAPTLSTIAQGVAAAVNKTKVLTTAGITASVPKSPATNFVIYSLSSSSPGTTTYTVTITGTENVVQNSSYYSSDSKLFNHELAADWTAINQLSACGGVNAPNSGYFSQRMDQNGVYFCDGNNGQGGALEAPYTNAQTYPNNQAILSIAYADIFGTAEDTVPSHEIFAEEVAYVVSKTDGNYTNGANNGHPNPFSRDYFFLGNAQAFNCTITVLRSLTNNGVTPDYAQWGTTGASSPPVECPFQ